ncbi:MAG: alanine racemase [Planctomycetes bacterium]|nr:alanine racemase [Planctomycetota bacterium]
MTPTSCIEVDLSRLDENMAAWQRLVGPAVKVCAVVKADGYGLGAVPIARRLAARGVKLLAVYNMAQATQIAAAGLTTPLLVLMPVDQLNRTDVLYRSTVSGRLHLTVHSADQLDRIEAIGLHFGCPIPIHIEIDTGMGRVGMSADEADRVIPSLAGRRYIKLAGIFTHPAAADDDVAFTDEQLARFDAVLERHADHIGREVMIHFANTYATMRDRRYHKNTVRLGLGMLGYGVEDLVGEPRIDEKLALKPVVRWTSHIVHVVQTGANAPVGYHGRFVTDRPTRLGVVPVGYADGYPLSLSNQSMVRVGANLDPAPVRGQINMDQISVDLTGLPDSIGIGSEVELIAQDPAAPNAMPKLAKLAGVNTYEMLCRLSPRILRRFVTTDAATGRVGLVATV